MPVRDARLMTLREALLAAPAPEAANGSSRPSVEPMSLEALDETPDPAIDRMEAAVALVVRARTRLDVLLIKRAEHEGDPWSGQMALPGGRWERTDSGLLHTARRETFEETGVDLARVGAPLGRLPDVEPASPRLPKMRIAPFVFGVPPETSAEVTSPELASVHWVPLDLLLHPDTTTGTRIHFEGFSKTFPSFHIEGEHVWGLTHRILTHFLERYAGQI